MRAGAEKWTGQMAEQAPAYWGVEEMAGAVEEVVGTVVNTEPVEEGMG